MASSRRPNPSGCATVMPTLRACLPAFARRRAARVPRTPRQAAPPGHLAVGHRAPRRVPEAQSAPSHRRLSQPTIICENTLTMNATRHPIAADVHAPAAQLVPHAQVAVALVVVPVDLADQLGQPLVLNVVRGALARQQRGLEDLVRCAQLEVAGGSPRARASSAGRAAQRRPTAPGAHACAAPPDAHPDRARPGGSAGLGHQPHAAGHQLIGYLLGRAMATSSFPEDEILVARSP
jgi:hypothetical protein